MKTHITAILITIRKGVKKGEKTKKQRKFNFCAASIVDQKQIHQQY